MDGNKTAEQKASATHKQSVFHETGLDDDAVKSKSSPQPDSRKLRFRSKPDIFEFNSGSNQSEATGMVSEAVDQKQTQEKKSQEDTPVVTKPIRGRFDGNSTMYRFGAAAMALAILLPLLNGVSWVGHVSPIGVSGGVIRRNPNPVLDTRTELVQRDNSPTDVCVRWAHQTALVNGTLYVYGGEASTTPGQTENTWNNDFLTLDLNSDWQISTPSLVGLPQPSGPPNVSLAALWNSYDSLYLYGGEFSWKPQVYPPAFAMWEYNIGQSTWYEHNSPTTSSGQNSGADGQPVQRAAEGASISIPSLGRGWYFGGHQDGYTTEGWSNWIARIYLTSLLEFTMPGYTNDQVDALSDNKTAGTDGNWRNITSGGLQSTAGFPERADGLLLYVPGFGANGILLGLAGGTNTTYQQMNEIDVFDIATSVWYKQATSGETPNIRVDPCAVVAAAPDGSSYNLYMFGGQSLQPAGNQTLYDDMWILTMPSFTWISVDTSSQSVPYARAGHSCNMWNGQMVVVGGYVGTELSCDSPGVYVFDMSNLKWIEQYNALSGNTNSGSSSSSSSSSASDSGSSGSSASSGASSASSTASGSKSSSTFVSNVKNNPFNQQTNQMANDTSSGGLEGQYGYLVPGAVQSVIGGASTGGATITAPAQTATAGPLKTGKPVTYTVTTGANGAIVTETGSPGTNTNTISHSKANLAAIIAPSVIAAILLVVACYMAFCAWLYRKRLNLYKRHLEMTQEAASNAAAAEKYNHNNTNTAYGGAGAALLRSGDTSNKPSSERRRIETMLAASQSHDGSSGRKGSGTGSGNGYSSMRRDSADSSVDLIGADEPTFWGTLLAPKRSLRVVNRD